MINSTFSGISFPPRKTAKNGFFAMATDSDLIKGNIYTILNTPKGSMPMNADFGNSAHGLLFEPINEITQGLIADSIKRDIEYWEPRVEVVSMRAASVENTRIFDMDLRIKATGQTFKNSTSFSV